MASRFLCPTCAAVYGALRAARVPKPVAKKVGYSRKVRGVDRAIRGASTVRKLKRKATKQDEEMRKSLKKANQKARKKDGSFKKGWTQSRVMKEAHRLRRMKR